MTVRLPGPWSGLSKYDLLRAKARKRKRQSPRWRLLKNEKEHGWKLRQLRLLDGV